MVDAAYCYRYLDLAWSVCWAHAAAPCKNRKLADLLGRLALAQEPCIRWEVQGLKLSGVKFRGRELKPIEKREILCIVQCFDAVGWAAGRASGL